MHTVWYACFMVKSPDITRQTLLESAYRQIHLHGFQATSINQILEDTGLTKGALYHHFKNKNEIGYAVVDEVIATEIMEKWVKPLQRSAEPIETIQSIANAFAEECDMTMVKCGCPLNNLIQEMSPIDPIFREKLNRVLDSWRGAFADAFRRGQQKGIIAEHLDPEDIGYMIIAIFEGISSLSKNVQDASVMMHCQRPFEAYLLSLKR